MCEGGGLTNRDVCYEICGDGIDMGNYECDDGNNVDGDGCSSACIIEPGWTCVSASPTDPHICTEICGDGLKRGVEECDDNNLINGDGCDSNCNIEFGWECHTDFDVLPSFCFQITWPRIIDYWISNDNKELTIVFNETILLSSL